jgi:broad specificity phosphatase PhoE
MQFYFIRHAQSADNLYVSQNAHSGVRSTGMDQSWEHRQADPELTDTGQEQIQRLGSFFTGKTGQSPAENPETNQNVNHLGITHVYSSLMIRTMETAGSVARAVGVTPAIWRDLHETGGIWTADEETGELAGQPGKNRAFFEERFPHYRLPDWLGEEGWWNRPLETGQECKDRALRFYNDLMEKHGQTDDKVVAVGHGLFFSFLINVFLKIPPKSKIRFVMNNSAITRIDFIDGSVQVVYQNRTDFLPTELVT